VKKFIPILLVALVFVSDATTFKLTAAENQPKQAIEKLSDKTSNSIKLTELHCISTKNGSKINFLTAGSKIYITACTPSSIDINKLKLIKSNTSSTKILVNRNSSLAKGYIPENLTSINSNKIKLEYTNLKLIPKTITALYSMVAAAKKNNVKSFIINSAYRNEHTQREIFNANLKIFRKSSKTYNEAFEKTRKLVALPGNSEHQTGLAIDIFSVNGLHRNNFEGTKEQLWLNKNSYKYGFIIRYPKDKTKETDSNFEPWHIRYVGIPLSSYLYDKNLCLEEFYDKIFAGGFLENNNYVFMKIKDKENVYIDQNMLSQTELESVKKGIQLLTVKKE